MVCGLDCIPISYLTPRSQVSDWNDDENWNPALHVDSPAPCKAPFWWVPVHQIRVELKPNSRHVQPDYFSRGSWWLKPPSMEGLSYMFFLIFKIWMITRYQILVNYYDCGTDFGISKFIINIQIDFRYSFANKFLNPVKFSEIQVVPFKRVFKPQKRWASQHPNSHRI